MTSNQKLNIVLVEPFFAGSHKSWAEGYKKNSHHSIEIISLKGIFWKWRMHGGAITLARMYSNHIKEHGLPDILLTTDMLNLPVFNSFANLDKIPIVTFFHENQLTYPWSTQDRDKEKNRDHHYGFINYSTALRSNRIMFNSDFHKKSFIKAVRKFLKQFPDHNELCNVDKINERSIVPNLGLDLNRFNKYKIQADNQTPIILWNHRWEYDKNPDDFFKCLEEIKSDGIDFQLVVLGEQFDTEMDVFTNARSTFQNEIIHIGYCDSFEEYAQWLWKADIIPVTTNQEFFGASIMEAVYCGTHPLLPKRLTYPELFRSEINANHFYDNSSELKLKLIELLNYKKFESLESYAFKYDWSVITPKYDDVMIELAQKNA